MIATAFDSGARLGRRRAIIRRNASEVEMVELRWGLKPTPFRFIRAERRAFPTRRCLIPASEFHVTVGRRRHKFSLEDGNWFYLAGIWRSAEPDWPESYAILTVDANPEVSRYQGRQGAVLLRRQRMHWLDRSVPEGELLQPLPARSFDVAELHGTRSSQRMLAL